MKAQRHRGADGGAARNIWDHAFHRPHFGVSERVPIAVLVSEFPMPEFAYDMQFEPEIGIVLDGRMEREYSGGWRQTYGPGDIWFTGIWEPHGYRVLRKICRRVLIHLWPSYLSDLRVVEAPEVAWSRPFTAPPPNRPRTPPELRPEVLRIGKELAACHEDKTILARLRIRHLTVELLVRLLDAGTLATNGTAAANGAPLSSAPRRDLSPAIAMALDSRQPVRVPHAAAACGMCVATFNRLFRGSMGITFAQFALRRRLSCVARELSVADQPLKKIAADWGFTDPSHLCRAFANHYRCTPAEYRARSRVGA